MQECPWVTIEQGFRLGSWVNIQRRDALKLDPYRREMLEGVPGWTWDERELRWSEGFERLMRFVRREGSARVLDEHVEDGFRLGQWVQGQRQHHKEGRLGRERTRRLEQLPGWTWNVRSAAWDRGFAALESFVIRNGHARVPVAHVEEGLQLGRWVNKQRTSYQEGRLSADRQLRLTALPGWTWHERGMRVERGFLMLEKYVKRERNANVPRGHLEDGFPLGRWVTKQRTAFNRGELSAERVQRLEAIQGWNWAKKKPRSEQNPFGLLEHFVDREGHARVSDGHIESGFKLGKWVGKLRQKHKQGKLDAALVSRLEAMPGWTWNPRAEFWEQGYSHMKRYVQREGHARVRQAETEGDFKLGSWVANQRANKARLTDKQRARLESVPGWSWRLRG